MFCKGLKRAKPQGHVFPIRSNQANICPNVFSACVSLTYCQSRTGIHPGIADRSNKHRTNKNLFLTANRTLNLQGLFFLILSHSDPELGPVRRLGMGERRTRRPKDQEVRRTKKKKACVAKMAGLYREG